MTRSMTWTGLIATLLIVVVLGAYAATESTRRDSARAKLQAEAVAAATDLYAENCAVCHGAEGEGLGAMPALANEGVRGLDYASLFDVIARGRYNTAMPGWSTEAGGVLTNAQIDQIIVLVQQGDWQQVGARVAELGLTPPAPAVAEVGEDLLMQVSSLPGGEALSGGLTLYAENCAACHGANLEGSALAPALAAEAVRSQDVDALTRTISQGVPSTLMAEWSNALTPEEIASLVELIGRWDEVQAAGITVPAIEVASQPATPEMIAEGEQLYNITCVACHGSSALGTPMAPALNNQTFLSETPDAAIAQIIAQGVPGTLMPAWSGRLTEGDISALVAYLRSLEPTAPQVVESSAGQSPVGLGPPWMRNP